MARQARSFLFSGIFLAGALVLSGCVTRFAPNDEVVILVKEDGTVDPSQEEVSLFVDHHHGKVAARWVATCLNCKLDIQPSYPTRPKWPGVDCSGDECLTKKLKLEHVGKQKYKACVTANGGAPRCGPDPWITINP